MTFYVCFGTPLISVMLQTEGKFVKFGNWHLGSDIINLIMNIEYNV